MKRWWICGGVMVFLGVLFQALARNVAGFGQWYATAIYPVWVGTIGRFFGLFPFSVIEIIIYLSIPLFLYVGIRWIRRPMRILTACFMVVSSLFLSYTLNCGINYYRQPFSAYLDFQVRESSVEELKELCSYLTDQVNELVEERDYSRFYGNEEKLAREAMYNLGRQYEPLSGYYPRPKGFLFSQVLSIQQLSGIYIPFTVEANYNKDVTTYNIPLTACHELSHLKGFMREDEANFIGYLASIQSPSAEMKYGGYLLGWIYANNSLAGIDREAYHENYQRLDARAREELAENSRFWSQYEGKIAEAANQINDTYLKINSQQDGVRSYGRVTDLMLAYFREQKN